MKFSVHIMTVFLMSLMSAEVLGQQLGDLSGRNLILNDGGLAGTTKNTILIAPQDAVTQLLSYSILLPSSPAPAVNAVLQVSAIAGTTATLVWTVAPTLNLPIVFEEQTAASLNIRRRTPFIAGVQGIPGGGAFDAQSTRTLATQTASAKYSGILTGENNTASGDYSLTLGGSTNISSLAYAIVGNGDRNTASGSYSAIMTGTLNVASNSYSTILNGSTNLASGQGSLILMGSGNIVSGDLSAVVIGRNNTIAGAGSVSLQGNLHSIVGDNSVVLGGRSVTINSSNTLVWNGAIAAFAVTASNTAFFHNADVILTNGNGASTRLMFLEPNAILTYPAAGANFAAFKAGVMAADNVYTLPTAVGVVGQVLKITTVTGTDATTQWQNDLGGPLIQNVAVVGATAIAINANVTYLRITSNVGPGAAPITFVPPAGYSDGTILVVRIIGAAPGNGVSIVDGAGAPNEFQLSGNFLPQADDTITLVWDATTTTWLEVSRRNN